MPRHGLSASVLATVLTVVLALGSAGSSQSVSNTLSALDTDDVRAADSLVTGLGREGRLRLRDAVRDPALPARVIERFEQRHEGVPVWGAEVVRDSENGVARSVFGEIVSDLPADVNPALSAAEAASSLAPPGAGRRVFDTPTLVIAPDAAGRRRLAYVAVVADGTGVERVFLDANTGAEILRYSEIQTQAAVGTGVGVLGDAKKISVANEGGVFVANDLLRPPTLLTYDMRGNLARALSVINLRGPLFSSDRASDADNAWTDVAQVDGHVHAGWTYDYYFKRFGRRGLDDRDRRIEILTNLVSQQSAPLLPLDQLRYAINAAWCGTCGPSGTGLIYLGNGIPPNLTYFGRSYTYFAGALDIVAHELTHGVIDSSSRLIYLNESGALNEAFADIMGTSVEFFFQPPGSGPGRADYLLGEDIDRGPPSDGSRSLANPLLLGDPDHYSRRVLGPADSGGVHTNSGIANHAFYLAIEGGVNRTSGLAVAGVGAANREQIEQVFYRAFVFLLPANATFSMARATTIQAARDRYGAGGAVERAVTQAWTAVGVQ